MRALFITALTTAALAAEISTEPFVEYIYTEGHSIRELLDKEFPNKGFVSKEDMELQATNMIEALTGQIKHMNKVSEELQARGHPNSDYPNSIQWTCDNRIPEDPKAGGEFLPAYIGAAGPFTPTIDKFTGRCFDFTVEWLGFSEDFSTFDLQVVADNKSSLICEDTLWLANTEMDHIQVFTRKGTYNYTFPVKSEEMKIDLGFSGLKVFQFCSGIKVELLSVLNTLECFLGGLSDHPWLPYVGTHTPPYQERANVEFYKEAMNVTLEERPIYEAHVSEDLIQSGDFFAITRLDGLDQIINYGTGGIAGHSVMALRFPDEETGRNDLYIVESQDSWYWPTAGLQRTPYQTWMQQARDASFNVVWMPLNAKSLLKFDQEAARQWFYETEGLPYGYHNFLFSWLNTEKDNLPPVLANEFLPILASILNQALPTTIDTFFTQAINHRLNTTDLSIAQAAAEAATRHMTLQDVMAMPEQDGWIYHGEEPRDGLSYVCSCYVASLYQAAGLFDDLEINATEFTPRDIYNLDFFDKNFNRPQSCVEADPELPYCQLFGKYRFDYTNDWSYVSPYAHMNENCPSIVPDYIRPDGC